MQKAVDMIRGLGNRLNIEQAETAVEGRKRRFGLLEHIRISPVGEHIRISLAPLDRMQKIRRIKVRIVHRIAGGVRT